MKPSLERLRDLAMAEPSIQRELVAQWDPDEFSNLALSHARAHGIDIAAQDLKFIPDPAGAARFLPRPADGAQCPPPGWLPVSLTPSTGHLMVDWLCFDGIATDAPFFHDALSRARQRPFNRLFGWRMRLADMLETSPQGPRPAGLIFHLSRCGSTLVHRMLGAGGSTNALSEVSVFDETLQISLRPDVPADDKLRLLRMMAAALGNAGAGKPLVLKLDAWHIQSWPLLRAAFPDTPAVFLCREPVEILVSQQRMRGIQAVPQPAMAALFGVGDYDAMSPDEYYAVLLAASCRTATAAARDGALRVIGYGELPQAVFTKILPHFGLQADAAAQARMRDVARFHSKSSDEHYVPDAEEKTRAAGAELRALVERIAGPAYRELAAIA